MTNSFQQYLAVLFIISFSILAQADDSAISGWGDNLHPIQETRIELRKEVLTIRCVDVKDSRGWFDCRWYVDVYFEFFNPDEERTLRLAFVAQRDDYDSKKENRLADFTIQMNGGTVDCERTFGRDLGNNLIGVRDNLAYFVFEGTFPHGNTTIQHTYNTGGGLSTGTPVSFWLQYVLRSGSLWAGSKIGDFTVNLVFESDFCYTIGLPSAICSRMKLVDHHHVDLTGKQIQDSITAKQRDLRAEAYGPSRLTFHANDYSPTENLFIVFNSYHSYGDGSCRSADQPTVCDWACASKWLNRELILTVNPDFGPQLERMKQQLFDRLRTMDQDAINLILNLPFARAGYRFKDPKLFNFYSRYSWYKELLSTQESPPRVSDIQLSESAHELIRYIRQLRNEQPTRD